MQLKYFKIIKENMENIGDPLAHELILLAWIRSSIGLMLFGFIMGRLAMLTRQISLQLGYVAKIQDSAVQPVISIVLILLGTLLPIIAFLRYFDVQSRSGPTTKVMPLIMAVILTFIIVAIGTALICDLIQL